jgi:hypothetical protein
VEHPQYQSSWLGKKTESILKDELDVEVIQTNHSWHWKMMKLEKKLKSG